MSSVQAQKAIDSGWSGDVSVSMNKRDVIIYALGTGARELQFTYENNDKFAPLPWYPIVLAFKGQSSDVVGFPSDPMIRLGAHVQGGPSPKGAVLDGERFLEVVNPIPSAALDGGVKLALRQRCVGVYDKKSGAVVEMESTLFDAVSKKQFVRMVSSAFYVGVTGFESAGKTLLPRIRAPKRAPDKVVEEKTLPWQAHLYRLSGDYNPLHIDPTMAKMFGFKQPILHGLCSFGFSARHVLKAYADNNPKLFKAIRVRFSKPVFPGETLVTKMWKEGNRVFFQTEVKERGKVCMSDCFVDLHSPAAKL